MKFYATLGFIKERPGQRPHRSPCHGKQIEAERSARFPGHGPTFNGYARCGKANDTNDVPGQILIAPTTGFLRL